MCIRDSRYICPKGTDLHKLGLNGQDDANLITSHINSFPKERLNGKTPFEMLKFLNPEMAERLIHYGIVEIEKDKVVLCLLYTSICTSSASITMTGISIMPAICIAR